MSAATLPNIQYAVFAGDVLGAGSGDQSIFTTVATTWTGVSNTVLGNMQAAFDTYITASNGQANHNTVADGASFVTQALGGSAYAGVVNAYGGNTAKIGNAGGDASVVLGTNMNVFNIVRNGTNGLTTATATKLNVAGFNPYFNLDNTGALTYTASVAAVPEADTYAMFLAGLGLMGFIARRRMSV